jgi:hypothetical protein
MYMGGQSRFHARTLFVDPFCILFREKNSSSASPSGTPSALGNDMTKQDSMALRPFRHQRTMQ